MMSKRPYIVGEVNGYPVGSTFEDRKALARAGVHRSVRRGIDWGAGEPACSIVLSAGYSVDNDMGKIVIYSGEGGGLDPSTQGHDKQTTDQEWKRGNAGLLRAYKKASPVRLIRSFRCKSDWAPHEGLRYDGLYTVTKADLVKSKAGLEVCVFKLISQPGQGPIPRKTGYGSFTMYESSDMEESEKEDQLEEEEYRTPPTKCWHSSILDLPLDSDPESDEDLILRSKTRTFKATPIHSATASSSKRTLDVIEFSSDSEDDDGPSPSKKYKIYPVGRISSQTTGNEPKTISSPEVIEILDTDEEEELVQRQKKPIFGSNRDFSMGEDQPQHELSASGGPDKARTTSRFQWLLDSDYEDDDLRRKLSMRRRIRGAAWNQTFNGHPESRGKAARFAEDKRCGTEVTDEDDLTFVHEELDDGDVKEEEQDIRIAIAELQRAHELAFGRPEDTHEKQERIIIDLTEGG